MTDATGSGSSSVDGRRRRHRLDRRWLHRGDDRGAILVISALVLVALVGIAAIVVDLGMARETRREAQFDADLSALAAGWFLAGNGSASYASNPRAACEAALTSVATNIGDWPAGASLPCTSFPTSTASCTSASTATTVSATGASPYALTVAWPVPASALTRAEFAGGTGVADGGPCERMSVDLRRQNPAFFAGVFGRGGEQVRARAVVRVDSSTGALGVPALLFLEREDCSTLDVSSGGQSNAGVHVLASSTSPGYIHTDSHAQGSGCSNNANHANGNSIWGTALPSAGGPSIRVDGVGGPGRIGLYSLSPGVDGRGAKEYQAGCTWVNAQNNSGCANSGLSVAGTGADIVSRLPVDTKYGVRIATLYGTARSAAYGAGTNTNAWTVLSGNACTNLDGTYPASGTANYYLNCDAAVANNATAVFNGSVVVRGALSVAGSLTVNGTSVTVGGTASVSGTWAMPNVRSVAVRGCAPTAPPSC